MGTRILLVEDEHSLAETIKLNLELEGYYVTTVNDGKKALKAVRSARYDLVILDVMLPEMDGFTVCESIRIENNNVPVLFLTAKSSSADRINGLRIGADDYLTKPFNLEEMLLRINNLLKRGKGNIGKIPVSLTEYTLNGFKINFPRYEVKTPAGKMFELSKTEAAFLKFLIERKNEVLSREHILETVWGYDIYPSTRSIDNYMLKFRKYFEKDQANPRFFHSVRGVGYKFTE